MIDIIIGCVGLTKKLGSVAIGAACPFSSNGIRYRDCVQISPLLVYVHSLPWLLTPCYGIGTGNDQRDPADHRTGHTGPAQG